MSTYLPNVKDYIPQVKAYTPDFKFLSDSLDQRQDRYNSTTKQLNNIYGEVVHADISREDNKSIRDTYAEELVPKIQQISGLDFSLAQNVQAAKGLFKPFYEDQHIVRDIVFTKAYKDQMTFANSLKNASTSNERERYWDNGVEFMNYQLQDFKNKTRDESMDIQLPVYTEDPDVYKRGLEALYTGGPEGKGLKVTETFVDGTGQFIVTQENGVTLTSKPTGKMIPNPNFDETKKESRTNPKEIEGMYNPAGERIKNAVLGDPLVQQGLRVEAYVKARKYYEEQAEKSGLPEDQFKREWATNQINLLKGETQQILETEREELSKVNSSLASWETYTSTAALIAGSDEYLKWFFDMTSAETISAGIEEVEKRTKDILSDLDEEDIDSYMNRGYAAYITNSVGLDIFEAARQYSDETFKRTMKESQIYVEKLRHRNNKELEQIKQYNIKTNKLLENLEAINAASSAPTAIPGDEDNTINYGSLVDKNENAELSKVKEKLKLKVKGIMSFYSFMADGMNGDVNIDNMSDYKMTDANSTYGEVSSAGIYVPNKNSNVLQFYRWEDSWDVLMENPELLEYHYLRAKSVYEDPDIAASYKLPENIALRKIMSSIDQDITLIDTKMTIVKDKQQEVYNNVIADLDLSNIKAGLGQENLEDWEIDLFDDNGYMRSTDDLYNDKLKTIVNDFRTLAPASLLSNEDMVASQSQDGNWITTDQGIEGAILSTAEAQNAANQGRKGGFYGLAYAANHKLLKPLADKLGITPERAFINFYPMQEDGSFKLTGAPGSKDPYMDLASNHIEWGSFKQVIDKVKLAMNEKMTDELAINGVTTFDFNSYWHGDGTVGDMAYAPVIPFRFDAGTLDKYVNNELDYFFNTLDNLPNNQIIPMTGDQGGSFSATVNADDQKIAYMILNQIRADRSYIPGKTSKASDPGFRFEYSSVGGGTEADGNYAMYKFILDSDYAKNLAAALPAEGKNFIQDNTLTIFLNKDLFSNPLDPEQQYKSTVKTMITMPGNHGRATLNVANGGIIHFEMNNGLVTQKYAGYNYNTTNGNMELSNFSAPQALLDQDPNSPTYGLPITDVNIDAWYLHQRKQLETQAETNLTAQTNYKLTQSNSSEEEEEVQVNK